MKKSLLVIFFMNYAVVGFAMQRSVLQAARFIAPAVLPSDQRVRDVAGCNVFKRTQILLSEFKCMHQDRELQRQRARDAVDLICAVYSDDRVGLKNLIERRQVDPSSKSIEGLTALFPAVQLNNRVVTEYLVQQGSCVNASAHNGVTVLMLAVSKADESIVTYLIQQGAKVNAQDMNGKTALMIASEKGNLGMVRLLLQQGADYRLKSNSGHDAREYALNKKHLDVVKELIENMMDHK